MTVSDVFAEAWRLYRLLFRRSVATAALVFVAIDLLSALATRPSGGGSSVLVAVVAIVLGIAGDLLVQGALVEVVRDVHEGRAPAAPAELYRRIRPRLAALLWGSLIYGVGVAVGLLLLVVPGLVVLARWALIVPVIVLTGRSADQAPRRSSALVRGHTGRVLGTVLLSLLLVGAASAGIGAVFFFLPRFWEAWIGGVVASSLTAPFAAHVLTVLYYRLTEPGAPVIPAAA